MRALHTLIFVFIAACTVFAQNENAPQVPVVDSTNIYSKLIAEEGYDADYTPNTTGMLVGGSFTGIGLILAGFGTYAILSNYNPKSYEGAAGGFIGTLFIIGSIPFLGIGIPVLSYNIYKYNERKGHANKRDEYQRSLDSYNQRRGTSGSIKMSLFPSLDFFNGGGGLNLLMQF